MMKNLLKKLNGTLFFSRVLLCLIGISLVTISCSKSNSSMKGIPETKGINPAEQEEGSNSCNDDGSEVVVFIGNPGAGKSTLLNTILQSNYFKTDSSLSSVTIKKQEKKVGNTIYIDTPGLSDPVHIERAAEEIYKSLGKNKRYKIVFFCSNQRGIQRQDIVTGKTVSRAIKTNFEYGIIFNKTPYDNLDQLSQKDQDQLKESISLFVESVKQINPEASYKGREFIKKYKKKYISDSYLPQEAREKIMDLLNKVEKTFIEKEKVEPIDVSDYDLQLENDQLNPALKKPSTNNSNINQSGSRVSVGRKPESTSNSAAGSNEPSSTHSTNEAPKKPSTNNSRTNQSSSKVSAEREPESTGNSATGSNEPSSTHSTNEAPNSSTGQIDLSFLVPSTDNVIDAVAMAVAYNLPIPGLETAAKYFSRPIVQGAVRFGGQLLTGYAINQGAKAVKNSTYKYIYPEDDKK